MSNEYFHGARARKISKSSPVPITANSGITVAVGTAPVHITGNSNLNAPVMAATFNEAAGQLGYSDNWPAFTLCEVMDSHFRQFATSPVFFINVLNPEKHKKTVSETTYTLKDKRALLPIEAIKETVKIAGSEKDTDFGLFYQDGNLVLEVIEGGNLYSAANVKAAFDAVDPSKVTAEDIIGGFDLQKKTSAGLELLDKIFPAFGILPDILIAPGWSHKSPEIAAAMGAKASKISTVFEGIALIDVDTDAVKYHGDVPAWKKQQGINMPSQALLYPKAKSGDKVYHLSSLVAALMAVTDAANDGCPSESPSNKKLSVSSTILADGTEEYLDIGAANFLNANGVITALNFGDGFKLWGNEMACFPEVKEAKQRFISVNRMFSWVSNSLILSHWAKVDSKLTRRMIDSVVDSANIWINGLTSSGHCYGGRVEYRVDDNPAADLENGISRYHVFLTPVGPAQEIEFLLEYDQQYLTDSLG